MSSDWIRSILSNAEESESFRALLQEPKVFLLDAWEEIISFKDLANAQSDKSRAVADRIVSTYLQERSSKSIVSIIKPEIVEATLREIQGSDSTQNIRFSFDDLLAQIETDLSTAYRQRRSTGSRRGSLLSANSPLLGNESGKRRRSRSNSKSDADGAGWRNIIAWFLLGLINNFGYVVMLSAADDLGKPKEDGGNPACLHGSIPKGAVLLADILPGLFIKVTAPFFIHLIPYWIRVIAIVVLSIGGFHMVGWPTIVSLQIVGICITSLASGLGESTFLALSSFYHKNVISAWSSGTGGAGIFGSLFYLALTTWIGVSPFVTLMIASVFPLVMLASYFLIMTPRQVQIPPASSGSSSGSDTENSTPSQDAEVVPLVTESASDGSINNEPTDAEFEALTFLARLRLILPLLIRYMLPLILVYYAEYLINQGVTPALKFPGSFADNREYVYYQFLYQSGVFISRSSVNLFQITFLWIFPALQIANLIFLFCQAYFKFIPSIWIIFVIIFFEGLLGGGCYVNVYYTLSSREKKGAKKEFSMATVSMSDAFGISLAAASAIPTERFLVGPPPVCP